MTKNEPQLVESENLKIGYLMLIFKFEIVVCYLLIKCYPFQSNLEDQLLLFVTRERRVPI